MLKPHEIKKIAYDENLTDEETRSLIISYYAGHVNIDDLYKFAVCVIAFKLIYDLLTK